MPKSQNMDPYRPEDGWESLEGPDFRVVRGDSWFSGRRFARCASHLRLILSFFDGDLCFRVVWSLASPEP
jgi:formylglycine-generating enzyme required for sulfatase activity